MHNLSAKSTSDILLGLAFNFNLFKESPQACCASIGFIISSGCTVTFVHSTRVRLQGPFISFTEPV